LAGRKSQHKAVALIWPFAVSFRHIRVSDLILVDSKGGSATVTTANVYQSNGVIHVIDTVIMPAAMMGPAAKGLVSTARGAETIQTVRNVGYRIDVG